MVSLYGTYGSMVDYLSFAKQGLSATSSSGLLRATDDTFRSARLGPVSPLCKVLSTLHPRVAELHGYLKMLNPLFLCIKNIYKHVRPLYECIQFIFLLLQGGVPLVSARRH